MTPGAIIAMLEVFTHPPKHRPSLNEYWINDLYSDGLIDRQDELCGLTAKGRAHVEQLCTTPWPTVAWIAADGRRLETV